MKHNLIITCFVLFHQKVEQRR